MNSIIKIPPIPATIAIIRTATGRSVSATAVFKIFEHVALRKQPKANASESSRIDRIDKDIPRGIRTSHEVEPITLVRPIPPHRGSKKNARALKPEAPNMRAAIYARVSTNNGQDPTMQTRELREYCQRRGWEIEGEYVDAVGQVRRSVGHSWMASRRVPQEALDAVVVYRYDRFARSLDTRDALEEFRLLGIEFVSLYEGVDTSTPNGRLVFGIFASIAEFERELIGSIQVRDCGCKVEGEEARTANRKSGCREDCRFARAGPILARDLRRNGSEQGNSQRALQSFPSNLVPHQNTSR